MKALVGAFNQEKALVGAFSVILKTGCGTDGALHSTICYGRWSREVFLDWRAADVAVPLLSLSDIRDWRLGHL